MRTLDYLIAGFVAELAAQLASCAYLLARRLVAFDRYALVAAIVLVFGGSIIGALAGVGFSKIERKLPGSGARSKAFAWFMLVSLALSLLLGRRSTVEEAALNVAVSLLGAVLFAQLGTRRPGAGA
jgi:hypothetical protein